MNKRNDEDFFEDLDKTTDLLKAFRPHIDNKTDSLDDLFNEYMNTQKQSQEIEKSEVDELTRSIQPIRTMKEAYELEQQIKEQQLLKKQEQERIEQLKQQEMERQQQQLKVEQKQAALQSIFSSKEKKKSSSKKQNKSDLTEIIGKMSETVEQQKQEKLEKQQQRQMKINQKKKSQKSSVKFSKFELTFCALSFLFIIGCIWVFGVDKNKDNNNEKSSIVSLSTAISRTTPVYSGDGLYTNSGKYIYKGNNVNNYLVYSGFLWRIIQINDDDTIDLVLDNSINTLMWSSTNKSYLESDIHKYLNNYFLNYLDKTYLEKVSICTNEVNDLKGYSCDNSNNDFYVRLLTLEEFNNSKTEESYISDTTSSIWLSTKSSDKVWEIRGNNVTLSDPKKLLQIKPVIKIKGDLDILSGNGTKGDPYKITEDSENVYVGSYIKLGNDVYSVYDIKDNKLKLALTKVLPNLAYNKAKFVYDVTTPGSLGNHLNTIYYNSLSYKDLLLNTEWYTGPYNNSYEDIYSSKVVAKVGIYDVASLKFDNELTDYYVSNNINNNTNIFVYNNESYGAKGELKGARPTISIMNKNVVSGSGSKEDPFVLEK